MPSSTWGAAIVVGLTLSLNGCGGGGDSPDGPEPHVGPTDAPHEVTTPPAGGTTTPEGKTTSAGGKTPADATTTEPVTTTATTTMYCTGKATVPQAPDTKVGRIVNELNRLFSGWNASDATSQVGVTIKMLAFREDARIYCGQGCGGGPDCRVSASVYNSEMPIHADNHSSISQEGRMFGMVFNQTLVTTTFGKCAYMYDASSWGRVNGGCGCGSKMQGNCEALDGPYQNQDCQYAPNDHEHWHPIADTCKENTEASPNVERCYCNSQDRQADTPAPEDMTTTSQQCFFRMPAMYEKDGLFESELTDMVKARLANQGSNETLANGDVRIKSEYWNEVIIDAEPLEKVLNAGDPRVAIPALLYIRGMGGLPYARNVQRDFRQKYGKPTIPIIEVDDSVDAKCSGLFRVPEGLEEQDGDVDEEVVV